MWESLLRKDRDKSIWEYFNGHWKHFFPKIPDRSNFAKQVAKLHVVKHLLQQHLTLTLGAFEDNLHIVDGLPMPLCKFARAHFNWTVSTRRLIETAIGQLTERFHIEKIRARDVWHQASRFWRKILGHPVCIMLNLTLDNEPLQFEKLCELLKLAHGVNSIFVSFLGVD